MTPTKTAPKTDKNFKYVTFAGLGLLLYSISRMGKATVNTTADTTTDTVNYDTTPAAVVLNEDIILKSGSKGAEVKRLQILMGISNDGIFGQQTEAALIKLKGVKQISIKQFLASPTINQNILSIGTNVMAKNKLGTPIYNAIAKADSSYYSDYKIVQTIAYGRAVGKIRSVNPAGNWYAIYYDTLFGSNVGFVKSTDVEKY